MPDAGARFSALIDSACEAVPEREIVLEWILREWEHYSNAKWGFHENHKVDDHDAEMLKDGWSAQSWWLRQVFQYADRAAMFGVGHDTGEGDPVLALRGRQAAMKMVTTLIDGLAAMTRVHGKPPEPGHTSGEVIEWK